MYPFIHRTVLWNVSLNLKDLKQSDLPLVAFMLLVLFTFFGAHSFYINSVIGGTHAQRSNQMGIKPSPVFELNPYPSPKLQYFFSFIVEFLVIFISVYYKIKNHFAFERDNRAG